MAERQPFSDDFLGKALQYFEEIDPLPIARSEADPAHVAKALSQLTGVVAYLLDHAKQIRREGDQHLPSSVCPTHAVPLEQGQCWRCPGGSAFGPDGV